jgi:GDSL-like lipase/acylhydrolase family protein
MRRLILLAGLALTVSAGVAGAQGAAQVGAQAEPSFSWVTPEYPQFNNATVDGSPDAGLLSAFAGDAGFGTPRAVLWDTTTASSVPLSMTGDYGGQTVVTSDGQHVFFSARNANSPVCDLAVSSRNGSSVTHVFGPGLVPVSPEGTCAVIKAGDGNRVLVAASATDPNQSAAEGWYVVDSSANARRIAGFSTNTFGRPYIPYLSANNVDALVPEGNGTDTPDVKILHLDGRPTTTLSLPAGYALGQWPLLVSFNAGNEADQSVRAAESAWTPDGSKVVVGLNSMATSAMRIGVLSMNGAIQIVNPNADSGPAGGAAIATSAGLAPVVSRDGVHVAYFTRPSSPGAWNFWVSKLDGSDDRQVPIELSHTGHDNLMRAGDAFAIGSVDLDAGPLDGKINWVSADGTSSRHLFTDYQDGSSIGLWGLQRATATTAYFSGQEQPGDSYGAALYALDLSDAATPERLIPQDGSILGPFVTGVSPDGNRVSGWSQTSLNQPSGQADTGYRGWTVTTSAPPRPLERYVVLGDSVPYGHGLANPKLDEPPSVDAYPELVRRGMPELRPLVYRPTGCSMVGDQLAISGAPSIVNVWTGGDKNCFLPVHQAVFPDETDAARLTSDPPAFVTVQTGADDLHFAACLMAVIGAPKLFGAETCLKKKGKSFELTSKAATELESLRTGLTAIVNTVHRDAPDAKIALIDYYQIIPSSQAPLDGTSLLCKDLRLQSKRPGSRASIRSQADFVQQQVNGVIRSVGSQFPDVAVVEIDDLFDGHELCTPSTWLFDGASDAAHPTAPGHQAIANAILDKCVTLPKNCIGR